VLKKKPISMNNGMHRILHGDCRYDLDIPDKSVDLVFCSPPYEDARTYGIAFKFKGDDWLDWAVPRYMECLRVCGGLVAWVVEGKTKRGQWSATPALLMARLHYAGVVLRKPPVYHRVGISGGGGRQSQHSANGGSADWLRNDYELIVCATSHQGKLPWADTLWQENPPKYPPGGNHSHHSRDGRVNSPRPQREGDKKTVRTYKPPKFTNPGNLIKCHGGKGHMGSDIAHENEAPFPEKLAEFFIRSFCPPGGVVLDPFCGSGTTAAVALKAGRRSISMDIRKSQCLLTKRRIAEAIKPPVKSGGMIRRKVLDSHKPGTVSRAKVKKAVKKSNKESSVV